MLLDIHSDESPWRVQVGLGYFREHHLNMAGRQSNLAVGLRKDSMRTPETDIRLVNVEDDGLVYSQAAW